MDRAFKYDFETMVQVSKMYYQRSMSQQDIAKELGWSRSMVSMILSEAKECGVVEVRIHDVTGNDLEMSERLKKLFSLRNCIVVPTSATSDVLLTKIVAERAAHFASEQISNHSLLGIAWGMTCREVMTSFSSKTDLVDVNVIPLIGGSNQVGGEYQLNEMVRIFAEKLRGIPSFIYAPSQAETLSDKELYMQSMYMQDISSKWEKVDTAIISVGASPEYYTNRIYADPYEMLKTLSEFPNRPVGDVVARRFTLDGRFLDADYDQRLIAVSETALRNTNHVICAASGRHKVLSIIGALRLNIIHSFVTDYETARLVVSLLDT